MKAPLCVVVTLLLACPAFALLVPGWSISIDDYSHDRVRLAWDDNECTPGTRIVQIFRDGAWETESSVNSTYDQRTIRGLTPETAYQFRVRIAGVQSQTLSFTTPPEFTPAPTAVTLNDVDVQVTWDLQPNAIGYHLEWSEVRIGDQNLYPAPSGSRTLNSPAYFMTTFEDLPTMEEISIRIHAILPGDTRSGWAETKAATGFTAPEPFNASRTPAPDFVRLSWTVVNIPGGEYEIQRSENDNQNYQALAMPLWNSAEYFDNSADLQKRYWYRIRTVDTPTNTSAWLEDDVWVSLPPAPSSLVASEISDTQVTIGWNEIPGIDGYAIQRSELPFTTWDDVGEAEGGEFIDGLHENFPVFPGNTYHYRVKGLTGDNQLGDTPWSATLVVTTPSAAPASLNATLGGGGSFVSLSWPDVFGETGYRIEKRSATLIGNFGSWTVLAASLAANTTTDTDGSVAAGMRYQYRIRSMNDSGDSSWTESPIVGTSSGVPLNVAGFPGSTPGANDCSTVVTVSWDQVPGATGYVVRRSLPDGTGQQDFVISGGSTTTFTDTGLSPYTVYKYQVKSTSGGPDSAFGYVLFVRTCPHLNANSSGTTVNVSWTDMTNQTVEPVSEYRLERKSEFSSWEEIATIPVASGPSYADTDVLSDSQYSYRMRGWWAADGGSFTAYSVTDTATTGPPPVTGFAVTDCDRNSVTLEWDPAYSATEIKILRSPENAGSFSIIATLPGTETSYTDTGLTSEAVFDYWIFATSPNGENSGDMLKDVYVKFPNSIVIEGPDSATIDWDPITTPGISQYRLEKDSGAGWVPNGDFFSFVTSAFKSGLNCGDKFRVRAVDSGGSLLAISETVTFDQPPLAAPGPINPSFPLITIAPRPQSSTSMEVEWGEVSGNNGYRLERREGSDGPWEFVTETATDVTTFLDTGLTPETTYFYRASGLNVCGTPGNTAQGGSATTYSIRVEWRVGYWGSNSFVLNGFGNFADLADFDGDGCLNIFEFFHDTDPTDPADCTNPTVVIIPDPGGDLLEVSWPIRADTDGIAPSVDVSGDLVDFEDSEDVGASYLNRPGEYGITIPLDTPVLGVLGRKIVRLRLSGL